MDIYPCVADENWSKSGGIQVLFGDLCSGSRFAHDEIMQLQQKITEEPTQDGNMSSSYQSFSQSIDGESQYNNNQGIEETNKYEPLGLQEPLDSVKALESKSPSPIKSLLKRDAPGEGTTGNELQYPNAKRTKPQVEGSGVKGADGDRLRTEMNRAWDNLQRQTSWVEESGVQVFPDQVQTEQLRKKVRNPAVGGERREGEEEEREQKREQAENRLEKTQYPMGFGVRWTESQRIESRGKSSPPPRQSEYWLHQRSDVSRPILNQDVEVEMEINGENEELQVASHRLAVAPSHVRTFETTLSILLDTSDIEQFDPEALQEATLSALGLEGKTWWNVDLETTRSVWRYRKEEEL